MEVELIVKRNGYKYRHKCRLLITEDRIFFEKSPFGMKDEIKSMRGPRWHGFDKDNPRKIWSVENCARNVFQLHALMGEDVYAHFDQPLIKEIPEFPLKDKLMGQQEDMVKRALTYHFQILAAEQGLGKSLSLISTAMIAGGKWWYIGPKSAGVSFELELEKWGAPDGLFEKILTYEGAQKVFRNDPTAIESVTGIGIDESTGTKNASTNRAKAVQWFADSVREHTNHTGYVLLLSGTPTAKSPGDIWSQAEIAYPGFLREGSLHAFKERYAIREKSENQALGVTFFKELGWNEPEVEKLPDRLKGLMQVYRKTDWLDLPEKKFRRVRLEPSKKVLRVAKALVHVASGPAVALTWLRALSSGFQYVMEEDGMQACKACNMMPADHDCSLCDNTRFVSTRKQVTRCVKTPKEDALRTEMGGQDRIIISASFKGSIDRCQKIAMEEGYAVCRVDGRGWHSYDLDGNFLKGVHPMRHWKECPSKVAFVGNPGSCKYGLTLVEAKRMVFFDNDFSAENRLQMIDRFHRIGQDSEVEVVDLIHLPVDEQVLDILDSNRSTELLSLGAMEEALGEINPENIDLE